MYRKAVLVAALVLAVLALVVGGAGCQREPGGGAKPLSVGIVTWPGHAIPFLAKEKEFFGDLKVDVKIIDDSSVRHAAFKSGDIDIMAVTVDAFALEAVQVQEGKFLFVNDVSNGGDAIVARKEVNSQKDLVGKKVAFPRGQPSQFLLFFYLKQAGLGLKDIKPVEVEDPSVAGQAFIAGNVDAAVTWEPFVSQAASTPNGKVLFSTADAPGLIIDAHVASNRVFQARRKDLEAYAKGILRALEYIKTNPDDAYAIMAKGLNMPLGDFKDIVPGLKWTDRQVNKQLFGVDPPGKSRVAEVFEGAGVIWKELGLLPSPLSAQNVIDQGFINAVLK